MGVYLYPNNTETELKNAYIGEYRVPGENTVLYYSFDNDTASTSYDGASGGYDGIWNNNTGTYQTVSGSNKCCELTATSGKYMSIPTSFTYPTTNFTISFWVKYTQSTNTSSPIFSKWNGSGSSTNAYLYLYQINGKIGVDIPFRATLFTTSNTYNDGIRHNVVLTKSGSSYILYIDNVQVGTATNSFSIHGGSNTVGLIGKNNNGDAGINGLLDEFIIENVAWTTDKRTAYYNSTKSDYGL